MFEDNKSVKEYLVEKYNSVLEEKQDTLKLMETPAEIKQREENDRIFEDAEELLSLNILNEDIANEYTVIKNRISDKKNEIEKLYGIKVSKLSNNVITVICEEFKELYSKEVELKREELKNKLKQISEDEEVLRSRKIAEANDKIEEIRQQLTVSKNNFEKDFEREKAEYEYNIKRERKIAQEKRALEIKEREEALHLKELEVNERKTKLSEKLEEIDKLQRDVDSMPTETEKAYSKGVSDKEAELGKLHKYEMELAKKEHEHKLKSLQDEYDRTAQKYENLKAEIAEISSRLDQCNMESRRLTGDTVKYIGGINILNSDAHKDDTTKK